MSGNKALTVRNAQFAAHFIIEGNATKAAKLAGYSEATAYAQGSRLMKDPLVRAEIERLDEERNDRLQLSADKVLTDIHRNARKAEKAGEHSAAIRGHELLGKHLKLFVEKHELVGKDDGPIQVERIERVIVDPAAKVAEGA